MNTNKNNNSFCSTEGLILTIGSLLILCTLWQLLIHCHYGLDLTDESFYLIWMSNPWIYPTSISQFGFIYHPLAQLMHGDITLIRQGNLLITFGLAWLLFITFFQQRLTVNIKWHRCFLVAISAMFATCVLTYYCTYRWLLTPSYNSLIVQALLIASIGILLAEKIATRVSILGWILIGLAGWLAFMAKPPSAGALAIVTGTYLLLSRKFNYRLVLLSIFTAIVLLIITAFAIDGSIAGFINRNIGAMQNIKIMQLNAHLFRWDSVWLTTAEQHSLTLTSLMIILTSYLTLSNHNALRWIGLSLQLAAALIGFAILFNVYPLSKLAAHDFAVFQMLAIPFSTVVIAFAVVNGKEFMPSRSQWALSIFFIVLPYVCAFGTSNNYWIQSQLTCIFWVLAGLVFLIPALQTETHWKVLIPIAISCQVIVLILLQLAMDFPYRQPPLVRQYHQSAVIGTSHSTILMSNAFGNYIHTIQQLANKNGFTSNTPVIDLTGQSPGTLYVLGAKAIGQAWMIGGFSGSDALAISTLSTVDCKEIGTAWLFIEPDSSLGISPSILQYFGMDLQHDYVEVAEFNTPHDAHMNWDSARHHKQQLLKPIRSIAAAAAACEKARASRKMEL